jgi:hypothetical protein
MTAEWLGLTLTGMAAIVLLTLTGFLGGRIWERRALIQDWRDQDKAWQDLADFVVEVEKMRADLFGQHLIQLPEPGGQAPPGPPYPTDAVPCIFHGSHQATDPPCDPPEDTDWLANSGILFALDQQSQLDEFARWINSWTPPKLPAPRRGSQASLRAGRKG